MASFLLAIATVVMGHPGPSQPPFAGPIDIMILPHSHQDAGFIVPYSHVRDQLCDRTYETIFECLRDDSRRHFNVAEINFFSHWFDSKNASVQAQVRVMVAKGQWGFNEVRAGIAAVFLKCPPLSHGSSLAAARAWLS